MCLFDRVCVFASPSNLCRDLPADVLSSPRPAAEGCEATQSPTPGTSTPTIKHQGQTDMICRHGQLTSYCGSEREGLGGWARRCD